MRSPTLGLVMTGASVAWRPAIADLLAELCADGALGFTEVVAENIRPSVVPATLDALAATIPVIPHGVTLGLAGADRPDPARLRRLAELAERWGSPLVSEHVAFVRAAGTADACHPDVLEAGHLIPPPRTEQALQVLCENIRMAQQQLPVPLAVENIAAQVNWPEDQYSEGDYLTELVDRTGVGLVLDVANLFGSAVACGGDPRAELARFPLDAIQYVHIAGGEFSSEFDGRYEDTHGHDMVPQVIDLLGELIAGYPAGSHPGVMLERDTDVSEQTVRPEFARLTAAIAKAERKSEQGSGQPARTIR